jgi:hypothetical protein
MEKTNKIVLNSVKLPDNVNVNTQLQVGLSNTNKPIPLNDINTTVSQFEQFVKERKKSSIYRFYGVVKPVISNPLFNENIKIYLDNNNVIRSKTILSAGIFEKDGWVGYYNDEPDEDALQFNDNKSSLCEFFPFDPGYDRLKMLDSDGSQNYLFKITYPFETKDIVLVKNNSNVSLKDGIPIIEKFQIEINGRLYTGFRTAMNHGLREGDRIQLLNFIDNTTPNTLNLNSNFYRVFKLGNETNNKKLRSFVLDLDPSDIDFTIGVSTVKRVVNNKPSSYYVRRFKSITVDYKDYDLYPAAYGATYFNDDVAAFNFKTDIDVSDIVDNLGRPISELYLTIIKNDNDSDPTEVNSQYWIQQQQNLSNTINNRFWTPISGGYDLENDVNVNYNIRSYKDPNYINSNSIYYENIDESDEFFDGDIVEYNESELIERRLENVYHRINTIYRDYLNTIDSDKENKNEGYIYTPFNLIQIREFTNYINPVVDLQSLIDRYNITNSLEIEALKKSLQIPNYATEIATNVFKWRDLLDIGIIDSSGAGVDYPFESGVHYIYLDKRFYLQRQDPPCEFLLISEDITLGVSDVGNVQQDKFLKLLQDPTFLKYNFVDDTEVATLVQGSGTDGVFNLVNYNGFPNIELDVTLVDYEGEYELGKRDIGGGCIDFSLLKQNEIDDVC